MENAGFISVLLFGNIVYFFDKWMEIRAYRNKLVPEQLQSSFHIQSGDVMGLSVDSHAFMESMVKSRQSSEDRLTLCQEQIQLWATILLKLEDDDDSHRSN